MAGLGGAPTPAANLGADATVEGGGIADEGWVTVGLTSRSRITYIKNVITMIGRKVRLCPCSPTTLPFAAIILPSGFQTNEKYIDFFLLK